MRRPYAVIKASERDGWRGLSMRCLWLVGLALVAQLVPASATDDGCEKFAWSLARERAWFAVSDKTSVTAGETLAAIPKGAFIIKLQPASQASFALPPERKSRSDQWFGGIIRFPAVERPGIYQVTLSEEGWIDVIQDDRYARSIGSSGRSDCIGIRKSVRLEIDRKPFVLQLSGVASDKIVVAISPGE
jgi:hypothetical protein